VCVPGGKANILGSHNIGHSKQKKCICTCFLFRTVSEIELFHRTVPKLFIRKRYYVLFLIPVFIAHVTKLVQFTQYNTFSKIPPSTSMHFATRVRTWRVARLYSEIALSRKPFGIGHTYIYTFLLRMTDTVASQNVDLSSWGNVYTESSRQRMRETNLHVMKRPKDKSVRIFQLSERY
jgi:hypothetical protein